MAAAELAFCIAGIYACFLTWGVLQERVTSTPYYAWDDAHRRGPTAKFTHFVFLNLLQSMCACLVAFVYMFIRYGRSPRKSKDENKKDAKLTGLWTLLGTPSPSLLNHYLKVAFFSTIASPFGYASLKHVDYPTMILAKSCKLLPVIVMSFVLYRRVFEWYKYASVLLISLGVSLFTLWHPQSDSKASTKSNSAWGLVLLTVNLMIDGVTNSSQDYIFKAFRVNGSQMMFFMNLFSSVYMVMYLGVMTPFLNGDQSSDLLSAIDFSLKYPQSFVDAILFGILGSVGQIFIFYTLERFGSLILVTVNVTRKMLSMLLSVFWFNHQLLPGQWAAVGMVFGGIYLEAHMSRKSKGATPGEKVDKVGAAKEEEETAIATSKTGETGKKLRQRNK